VKIEHVLHEFSHLPGVTEDTLDIMMNLRKVVFVLHVNRPKILRLKAQGAGTVKASDCEKDADIEILTPEVPLATLEKAGELEMEVCVERGRGYVPAEKREPEALPINAILLDADFSPVQRVNFHVEPAADGKERLVLEVWTDGSVAPGTAVAEAARILEDHFELLTRTERNDNLFRNVEELELSGCASNCFKAANIRTSPTLYRRPRPSCSRRGTSARSRSTRSRRCSGRWASRSACALIPRSSSGCALSTSERVRRSASPVVVWR
jgi:DNA-directed RNA polymerase subunit alpha